MSFFNRQPGVEIPEVTALDSTMRSCAKDACSNDVAIEVASPRAVDSKFLASLNPCLKKFGYLEQTRI